MSSDSLLTLKQVAARLAVSTTTVKQLAIPFTRIGRQRRYKLSLIEKYEADKSSQPKAWRVAS